MATESSEQVPSLRQRFNGLATSSGLRLVRRREIGILVIVIAVAIYFSSTTRFLTPINLPIIAQYVSATAIIAIGEVFVIITGEIDLSVGVVAALAPFIMYFLNQGGIPIIPAIILALLVCAVIGLVNGIISVLLRVPSLITTLGMQFLITGITLIISHDEPVIPSDFGNLNNILGHANYSEFYWAVGLVVVFQIVLSFTRWGLHTVAAGGNLIGASEAGVKVNRVKIANFILAATLAGFAGILQVFNLNSIDPLAGGQGGAILTFAAVAGAVIGGTTLSGGSGTVVGALLGCLMVSMVQNGLLLMSSVDQNTLDVVIGVAILLAMIANVAINRWREVNR
jgi:simple sugar transport system permease protein